MYRNIIWDVDGTLFDTYPAMVKAFGQVLSDHGINPDLSLLMNLAKQSVGHCVATLASVHHLPETTIETAFVSKYGQIKYFAQPPFPHVREICSLICLAGGSNVIVTHRERSSTLALLTAHRLAELFKGWITHDDGYPRKPDPAAFKAALDKWDLDPKETMAVGDRDIDTIAAHGAGLFTCQFGPKSRSARPDLPVTAFAQLADFLQSPSDRGSILAAETVQNTNASGVGGET